jgi:glycosyltransferase involved in cell wall biosynthesis
VEEHDIVYANGTVPQLFLPAKLRSKPFVWTHATYRFQPSAKGNLLERLLDRGKLFLRRSIAASVDANVAISRHMAERQPLPRQQIIYNPVDVDFFAVDVDSAIEQLSSATCTFGFLGRMVSDKGVQHLLEAFARIVRNSAGDSSLRLKLIGDGHDRRLFEAQLQSLDIVDRVEWTGSLSGVPLKHAITDVQTFVVPSYWEEPMGVVAVELAAAGKPLIVSRRGGLAECVPTSSLTFENGDVDELCAAMLRLMNEKSLQREFVKKGIERAQHFRPQLIATQYLQLFSKLIGAAN